MLNLESLRQAIGIYQFKDSLFRSLSKQECILIYTLLHEVPNNFERKRYYRTTYLEDGVSVRGKIVHTLEELQFVFNSNNQDVSTSVSWRNNNAPEFLRFIVYNPDDNGNSETVVHHVKYTCPTVKSHLLIRLTACNKFHYKNKNCQEFYEDSVSLSICNLDMYNDIDIVSVFASSYTCKPNAPERSILISNNYTQVISLHNDEEIMRVNPEDFQNFIT